MSKEVIIEERSSGKHYTFSSCKEAADYLCMSYACFLERFTRGISYMNRFYNLLSIGGKKPDSSKKRDSNWVDGRVRGHGKSIRILDTISNEVATYRTQRDAANTIGVSDGVLSIHKLKHLKIAGRYIII